MSTLLNDIKYGIRMLVRNPGFVGVVVLMIGLGVGANTAIFNALDQVAMRALPVHKPHELVSVQHQWRMRDGQTGYGGIYSYPLYEAYRDQADVFSDLVAFSYDDMRLRTGSEIRNVKGLTVTGNYFPALGIRPALGRMFDPQHEPDTAADPVVVISDKFWRRHYQARPDVLGEQLLINDRSLTVIGVTPPGFHGTVRGWATDLYIPAGTQASVWDVDIHRPTYTWLHFLGRLKPGITRERARASLGVLNKHLVESGLDNVHENIVVADGSRGWISWEAKAFHRPLTLFMIVAAFILVIACVNVANMQLSRAAGRQKEIAIRQALGAGHWRVIRQLLVESLLLAAAGGVCGTVLATWLDRVICVLMARIGSVTMIPGLDLRVLSFALAVSLLTGLISGLAPPLLMGRRNVTSALKESSLLLDAPTRRWNPHHPLAVIQVAFAVMVLICAGLFVHSVIVLNGIDPGYDTSKLLAVSLEGRTFKRPELRRTMEDLYQRIKDLPGTEATCLASSVPLGERGSARGVSHIDGVEIPEGQRTSCQYRLVSPGYFKTLNMPLLAGRDFSARDTLDAPKVMVINEAMAETFWPHQNPLDRSLTFGGFDGGWTVKVIGVVKVSKMRSIIEEQRPFAHLPLAQHTQFTPAVLIRATAKPQPFIPIIRKQIASLGPLHIWQVSTVSDRLAQLLFPQRSLTVILNTFGFVGLLLCVTGIYSVIAYAVKQRTREIGIRMALGAETRHVIVSVLRKGACLTAIGLALGLPLSFAALLLLDSRLTGLRRWNKFILFGVDTWDLLTIVAVPLLVLAVALLACYLPARRAANIDPMQALRYE